MVRAVSCEYGKTLVKSRPVWPFPINTANGLYTGLVSWWPFGPVNTSSTTLTDAVGGFNGTLTNMNLPTDWTADSMMGYGLSFQNASNSNADVGTPAGLQLAGPLTVSAWVYQVNQAGAQKIVWYSVAGETHGYALIRNGTVPDFMVGISGVNYATSLASDISANTWYLLTGVYDSSNVLMYVNGIASGTPTEATGSVTYTDIKKCTIGNLDTSVASQSWKGLIADVKIWNRALSAAEVLSLYVGSTRWGLTNPIYGRGGFKTLNGARSRSFARF